mmetsp:Transcript_29145/g.64427  ORF Transcript_29145/g.64427 Transcript_29145/m.64427 type:complete len:249 (-) Transcript_29145:625-1371(-)
MLWCISLVMVTVCATRSSSSSGTTTSTRQAPAPSSSSRAALHAASTSGSEWLNHCLNIPSLTPWRLLAPAPCWPPCWSAGSRGRGSAGGGSCCPPWLTHWSWLASTAYSRAQSSTLRAMGPYVATVQSISTPPRPVTRPLVGFRPTVPQKELGMRMLPPPSLPTAKGQSPAATAAALPPEEPPVWWPGCQGLREVPVLRLRPVTPSPISCMLDLPSRMAPRSWRLATKGALTLTGRLLAMKEVPAVVG